MKTTATLRPTHLKGLVQAVLLFMFMCGIGATVVGEVIRGVMLASMFFLLYRFVFVREIVTRQHRLGVVRSKDERWDEALAAFQRSFRFWDSMRWLDDARGLLLASTSRYPFRVLALYNEAYVLLQLGRIDDARTTLVVLDREAPDMVSARGLRLALDQAERRQAGWGELLEEAG